MSEVFWGNGVFQRDHVVHPEHVILISQDVAMPTVLNGPRLDFEVG